MEDIELWAGFECTINRVGNAFRDQFVDSGHDRRPSDLDLIAGLGIHTLRYPIAWERVSPDSADVADWSWHDSRLARLRTLGIRVIAGLTHHGSGPRYTSLLADDFAVGLARHAREAAKRYPWVRDWTPVNEPLTTARFAALYGLWYPHHHDERSFWLALLNQIDAVRLAMREVRHVNPQARLIQTDDLGRTYATAALRDQAAFDNVRRWMGWDLLCGRVGPEHMMWRRLCDLGFGDRLRAIGDDPCPPDIIGVNHYLTSDRLLDHRTHRYPREAQGGNGARAFSDVAGVRVLQPPPPGLAGVLREAWDRYRLPLAITEVHNGCTREEQMRWTCQAWQVARALRTEGIDLRAVTSWALLGSHGWDTLLTAAGRYEAGVFDVRGPDPRPTALAPLLRGLAKSDGTPPHPVLAGNGWWNRPIRLHHAPVPRPAPARAFSEREPVGEVRAAPVLIVGGSGTLGGALGAACRHRDIAHVLTRRPELDLADPTTITAALNAHQPWAVINAAGWVRVDDAEDHVGECFRANGDGAALLARLCAERGIPTVSFSSDLVFDGRSGVAYLEGDEPAPLNAYGRSKRAAEEAIARLSGSHLIVRTAAFFSPFDPHNFAVHIADGLARGETQPVPEDEVVCPTYVPDLCDAVLDLAIDGETGLWHLTNGEALSWAEFGRRLAAACGLDVSAIRPVAGVSLNRRAPRPPFSALASARGALLPPLEDAIERFARVRRDGAARRTGGARPEERHLFA